MWSAVHTLREILPIDFFSCFFNCRLKLTNRFVFFAVDVM